MGKIPILTSIFFKWVEITNQIKNLWSSFIVVLFRVDVATLDISSYASPTGNMALNESRYVQVMTSQWTLIEMLGNPWLHWLLLPEGLAKKARKLRTGHVSNIPYFHPYMRRWSDLTNVVFQLSTQGKPPAQRAGIGLFLREMAESGVFWQYDYTIRIYQANWGGFFWTCNENSYLHHQPSNLRFIFGAAKDPAILQRPPGRLAHPERRTPEALLFWSAATAPEQHLDEHYPPNADLQVLKRWV